MGDPRHSKKAYQKPQVPWQEDRINEERVLMDKHGLRRKKELYRMQAKLKGYKETAKRLVPETGEQAEREEQDLYDTLNQYGLLREDTLTDVLSISIEQLLGRRLQTLLVDQDLAHSPEQARQFITHGHIIVDGERVNTPGYLVTVNEEARISFHENSPFSDEDHPERPQPDAHEEAERQGNTAQEAMQEAREEQDEQDEQTTDNSNDEDTTNDEEVTDDE